MEPGGPRPTLTLRHAGTRGGTAVVASRQFDDNEAAARRSSDLSLRTTLVEGQIATTGRTLVVHFLNLSLFIADGHVISLARQFDPDEINFRSTRMHYTAIQPLSF
jgi:hypothetical protein